jgi:cytochrome c oxidase subunit 4
MTLAEYRQKKGEPLIQEHEEAAAHEGSNHPTAIEYLQIGLILTIITAVEVGLYYIDLDHNLLVFLLVCFSILKFALVVLWFMHLKFDSRLFQVLFATGLGATFVLFTVVLAIEHGQFV